MQGKQCPRLGQVAFWASRPLARPPFLSKPKNTQPRLRPSSSAWRGCACDEHCGADLSADTLVDSLSRGGELMSNRRRVSGQSEGAADTGKACPAVGLRLKPFQNLVLRGGKRRIRGIPIRCCPESMSGFITHLPSLRK